MGSPLSKFIPTWISRFAANPSDKSLFYFQPNRSQYTTYKRRSYKDYAQILCDDEISSALDTRLDNMIEMPWSITGGNNEANNKFIWDQINANIYELVTYSWWAVFYGKSAFQVVWAKKGADVVIDKVYDEDFQGFTLFKGEWQLNRKPFVEGKYFITVNKKSAFNPEGSGLGDKLFDIFWLRKEGWVFFMKYLEKFGIPFFEILLGEDVSDVDKAAMKDFLNSDRPRGVILPNGTTMQTVDGRTSSVGVFDTWETIMRNRIQRVVLGETLTSGTGTSGSLALGEVHERVAESKTNSDSIMVSKTLNALILSIYQLNKMSGDVPVFEFQSPKGIQKGTADRDKVLNDIGVRFTKEYFVDTYEFDEKQIDYSPQASGGSAPTTFKKFKANHSGREFISKEALKGRISEAEKLENKYIGDSPNLGSVLDYLLKTSKTQAEFEKKLKSFLRKDTKEFDEALTEAMLKSSILGSRHAK